MPTAIQFLRTSTENLRPDPTDLSEGMPMVGLHETDPGLYFKLRNDDLCKIGPCSISPAAPNSNPVLQTGNTVGEFWLDTSVAPSLLKVWDGTQWVQTNSPAGSIATLQQTTDAGNTTTQTVTVGAMIAASLSYPVADGLPNQVIATDGAGNLTFVNQSGGAALPGGLDTQLQFNDNGVLEGTAALTVSGGQLTLAGDIVPAADNTYTFGSNGQRLANFYTTVLDVVDGGTDAGLF